MTTFAALQALARDIIGHILQFLSFAAGSWSATPIILVYLGIALVGVLACARATAQPDTIQATRPASAASVLRDAVQPRLESLGFGRDSDARAAAWRVVKRREFCGFFVANILCNWGTWLQNTAQILLAYKFSHSVLTVGLVTCVQFSTPLLFGPWAGVVADRWGARQILIRTQVGSAAITAAMAILLFSHTLAEITLYVGAFLVGLMFTFALPAQSALIPALFPEGSSDAKAAMTMNSVAYNAGRMIAPACTVLIIMTTGFGSVFAINAITFAVFAGFLYFVEPVSPVPISKTSRVRDGLQIARKNRKVLILLLCVASVTLGEDPVLVLGPGLARHAFHISYDSSGYFLCALGAGAVLSSLLPRRPLPSTRRAAAALGLLGISIMVFALAPWMWLSVAAAFSAGFCGLVAGSAAQAMLRYHAGKELALQVMGLWAIAWAGSKPFAALIDGLLPSVISVRATGVLMAVPALLPPLVLIFAPGLARRVIDGRTERQQHESHEQHLVPAVQ